MKIDKTALILDLDGHEILTGAPGSEQPLSLGKVCIDALFAGLPEDQQSTGAAKFRLYEIASAVSAHKDIPVEDVATLKHRIGASWSVLVVGRAYELIEAAATPSET